MIFNTNKIYHTHNTLLQLNRIEDEKYADLPDEKLIIKNKLNKNIKDINHIYDLISKTTTCRRKIVSKYFDSLSANDITSNVSYLNALFEVARTRKIQLWSSFRVQGDDVPSTRKIAVLSTLVRHIYGTQKLIRQSEHPFSIIPPYGMK